MPAVPPKKAGVGCIILLLSVYEISRYIQEEHLFLNDPQKFWTKIFAATLNNSKSTFYSIKIILFVLGQPLTCIIIQKYLDNEIRFDSIPFTSHPPAKSPQRLAAKTPSTTNNNDNNNYNNEYKIPF